MLTYAEYLQLDEDVKYEVIDSRIYNMTRILIGEI